MVANKEKEMFTNNKNISDLITRFLKGTLNDAERVMLDKWLETPRNKKLFNEITEKQNLIDQTNLLDKFKVSEAWDNIEQQIRPKRTIKNWVTYAAAVLVPLVLFISVYQLTDDVSKRKDYAKVYEIKPGENKAVLTLHDGSTLEVANADTLINIRKSGTSIDLDSLAADYTANKNKLDKELRYNTMITSRGREFSLTLEDGTKVWLNAASQLRYPERFLGNTREVYVQGEVYFEVAKDKNRPFYVHFDNRKVEVLGTAFNVRCYKDEEADAVTLIEGSVALKTDQKSVILSPDEQAIISHSTDELAVEPVNASIYAAWKDRKFVYNNSKLESILNDMARWYQLNVFYQNESMKFKRFSLSTNRYDSIEEMLEVLEATNKVKFEIFENNIVIKSIN